MFQHIIQQDWCHISDTIFRNAHAMGNTINYNINPPLPSESDCYNTTQWPEDINVSRYAHRSNYFRIRSGVYREVRWDLQMDSESSRRSTYFHSVTRAIIIEPNTTISKLTIVRSNIQSPLDLFIGHNVHIHTLRLIGPCRVFWCNCEMTSLHPVVYALDILEVVDNRGLTSLPNWMVPRICLYLRDNPNLCELPNTIDTKSTVVITGSGRLTSLPPMAVETLRLEGCNGLSTINPDVACKNISLRWCNQIKSLPSSFLASKEWIGFPKDIVLPGELFSCGFVFEKGEVTISDLDFRLNVYRIRQIFVATTNTEQRRFLFSVVGTERMMNDILDVRCINRGKIGGQHVWLYRTQQPDSVLGAHLFWVKVTCPSTKRKYLLSVPPERTRSVVDAVAFTFGLSEEEYAPLIET